MATPFLEMLGFNTGEIMNQSSSKLASALADGAKNVVPVSGLEKSSIRSCNPGGFPTNMRCIIRSITHNRAVYPVKYVPNSPDPGDPNGILSRRISCSPPSSSIVVSVLCDCCPESASSNSILSAFVRPMIASCCSVLRDFHAVRSWTYFCTTM